MSKTKKVGNQKEGYVNWANVNGLFVPQRQVVGSDVLPPGVYNVMNDNSGKIFFIPRNANSDELLKMPNTVSSEVVKEIEHFWSEKTIKNFEKYGLIHKRGILLHGKQGTGKSCTVMEVMSMVVQNGGVVLFNSHPSIVAEAMRALREIQPNTPLLLVYEEFDEWIDIAQSKMLSLLDGQDSLENVVFLATTNYISKVPARIKCRPSRFASVIEVGVPTSEIRKLYFQNKLVGDDAKYLDELVEKTEGFVIDQLKDVIVSVFCFDLSIDMAINKIREMEKDSVGIDDYNDFKRKQLTKTVPFNPNDQSYTSENFN